MFLALLISGTTLYADKLTADKSRGEWTLVVIPDTQGYTEDWIKQGYYYTEMKETFKWIASAADQLNIKLVQHLGDMVETHSAIEWNRVVECFNILKQNDIPVIPCAGNHEWEGDNDFINLNDYFSLKEYQGYPWWGGHYKGLQNTYQILTIGEEDYLFLTLQWKAGSKKVGAQDAIDWAVSVMKTHPDKKIIFTSHWNEDQHHLSSTVDLFPNIIMTLAGHVCTEDYYISHGRTHNFIQNYQCKGTANNETGDMQVRYYKFKPMEDKVEWFTYSVVANDGKGAFWTREAASQGVFDLVQKDPAKK